MVKAVLCRAGRGRCCLSCPGRAPFAQCRIAGTLCRTGTRHWRVIGWRHCRRRQCIVSFRTQHVPQDTCDVKPYEKKKACGDVAVIGVRFLCVNVLPTLQVFFCYNDIFFLFSLQLCDIAAKTCLWRRPYGGSCWAPTQVRTVDECGRQPVGVRHYKHLQHRRSIADRIRRSSYMRYYGHIYAAMLGV